MTAGSHSIHVLVSARPLPWQRFDPQPIQFDGWPRDSTSKWNAQPDSETCLILRCAVHRLCSMLFGLSRERAP